MHNRDLSRFLGALSENGIRFYGRDDVPAGSVLKNGCETLFYRLHSHPQLEIICLLQGHSALNINNHWRVCRPLLTHVLVPGAVHGERYLAPDRGYRMLWVAVSSAMLLFHITEYHPLTGYGTSGKRMAITPPMCAQLWETFQKRDFSRDPVLRAKFHYLLMECISFFLIEHRDDNMQAADYHEHIVEQVRHYVAEYYWDNISLQKLAGIFHYSPGHLNAVFRRLEKMPLHRYINDIRLLKARQLLGGGGILVKQAALSAGFRDPLYFSRLFNRKFGITPARFLKSAQRKAGKAGSPARFTRVDSKLAAYPFS